ncbi:TonB-dependent siderophore receptor, partial [Steroidobacter sp.]|uniref:TonB-dependent siderophore receptor n=1 Tax=Steroidobacter sp. TaxID=1978227 RepID=UPI001A5100EC
MRIATVATMLCLSMVGHSAASEARAVIKQPTNIQPQNLGAALRSLAKERNFQVVFASRDVAKLRTQGAVGTLTDDEALTQVLDGTGLVFRYLDEKTVTIVVDGELDSTAGLQLDRTTWASDGTSWTRLAQLGGDNARNGAQEVSASDTLEEVIITSTNMLISVGKTPASVRETPQSVSIITRQRIEEQNLVTLEDVLKEAPGLTTQMQGMGQQRFYSRGYEISVVQLDGVPTQHSPWNVLTPDLVMYDRAEVLRGADGLYSGAGSPGGTVNLVRKKPLNRFQLTGAAVLGSENHRRAEADVTGPLTESGKLRGRLVGAYDDREFFYDIGEERSTTAYAALAYDLTASTAITAGLEYRNAEGIPFMYGMPRYADGSSLGLSRSTFLNPAWNRRDYQGVTTHIELEQGLGSDWIARVTATRVDAQMKYKEGHLIWSSVGADGTSYPEAYLAKYDDVQSGVEVLLSGTVNLFGRSHDLQVGANWQKHNYTWDDQPLDVGNQPLDLLNWNPYALAEPRDDQTL